MKKLSLIIIIPLIMTSCFNKQSNELFISSTTEKQLLEENKKFSKYNIQGRVILNLGKNSFSTKATTISDILNSATISLIDPNISQTIATGLTDSNGAWSINPDANFTPIIDKIYELEVIKMLGSSANEPIALKTYIKWTSSGVQSSLMYNGLQYVSPQTTALSVYVKNNLATPQETFGKLQTINGATVSFSNVNNSVSAQKVSDVSNLVYNSVDNNRDPLSNIKYDYNNDQCVISNENKTTLPSYINMKFQTAMSLIGQNFVSEGSIVRTESKTGYKQSFKNSSTNERGILIYKDGTSNVQWIHGAIFETYISKGGTFALGYPTTNETTGFTSPFTGNTSVYQMFDGDSKPSLQYINQTGKTYLLNKGIRDGYWSSNIGTLGLPIGNEETNPIRQSFEKGTVFWNNGAPSLTNQQQGANEISIQDIQLLLNSYSGDLKDINLFRQAPIVTESRTYEYWPVSYTGNRSSDPKAYWQKIKGKNWDVNTPELKDGNASALSPAEIIYYAAKENGINPMLLITKLQGEQSLIEQGKTWSNSLGENFEARLYKATGYGINKNSTEDYCGFYPQLVGLSFQFSLFLKNGNNFEQAYKIYTPGTESYNTFKVLFARYVNKLNQIKGTNYSTDPSSINNGFGFIKDGTYEAASSVDCVSYPVGDSAAGTYSDTQAGFHDVNYFQDFSSLGYHLGNDLNKGSGRADYGLPIYTIGDGEVIRTYRGGDAWGNVVLIKHIIKGHSYVSMYAHLKDIQVSVGNKVTRKQQIGTLGDAGGKWSPHLHFEVRDIDGLSDITTLGRGYTKKRVSKGPQGQISAIMSNKTGFIDLNLCNPI